MNQQRKIDPTVEKILTTFGMDSNKVLWNCHGTWCMYHRALEKVAAEQGITFKPPTIIENDGLNKSVALVVIGERGDRSEWSIGEASPSNCKNAYPWATAEKRAKARAALKLLGLHGFIYSDSEMDAKPPAAEPDHVPDTMADDSLAIAQEMAEEVSKLTSQDALLSWAKANKGHIANLLPADQDRVRDAYGARQRALANVTPVNILKAG